MVPPSEMSRSATPRLSSFYRPLEAIKVRICKIGQICACHADGPPVFWWSVTKTPDRERSRGTSMNKRILKCVFFETRVGYQINLLQFSNTIHPSRQSIYVLSRFTYFSSSSYLLSSLALSHTEVYAPYIQAFQV